MNYFVHRVWLTGIVLMKHFNGAGFESSVYENMKSSPYSAQLFSSWSGSGFHGYGCFAPYVASAGATLLPSPGSAAKRSGRHGNSSHVAARWQHESGRVSDRAGPRFNSRFCSSCRSWSFEFHREPVMWGGNSSSTAILHNGCCSSKLTHAAIADSKHWKLAWFWSEAVRRIKV